MKRKFAAILRQCSFILSRSLRSARSRILSSILHSRGSVGRVADTERGLLKSKTKVSPLRGTRPAAVKSSKLRGSERSRMTRPPGYPRNRVWRRRCSLNGLCKLSPCLYDSYLDRFQPAAGRFLLCFIDYTD